MAKALIINPSYRDSYGSAKAAIVDPIFPTLGVMTISAMAKKYGHKVDLLDLSYRQYDYRVVKEKILAYKPDVVAFTGTTPLMNQIRDMSVLVKEISNDILTIAGGAHVSALPVESLHESLLDVVAVGEGEVTFAEVMDGRALESISGIHYRKNGNLFKTAPRAFIQNLDELPFPDLDLYSAEEYRHRISRLYCRRPPMTMLEFSRGCVFKCDFCASKNTMALGLRKKSPERCVEEVRRIKKYGYREFMLADDIFTSDNKWSRSVAEAIIEADLDMSWSCTNGVRVESAELDLFKVLKKSNCYRLSFGLESGNAEVLQGFGKGGRASIEKAKEAVSLARQAGLDTNGMFMLGLSPDSEKTMEDTIEFARSLPLDMLKFGIAIAFPGTKMFKDYRQKGFIRSYNWDDYFIYSTAPLFAHEKLSYQLVLDYMKKGYRRAILLNPGFIFRRIWRGIKTLEFFWDAYYFIKFSMAPAINAQTSSAVYYGKDKWPQYDFVNNKITHYEVRPSSNKLTNDMVDGVAI